MKNLKKVFYFDFFIYNKFNSCLYVNIRIINCVKYTKVQNGIRYVFYACIVSWQFSA